MLERPSGQRNEFHIEKGLQGGESNECKVSTDNQGKAFRFELRKIFFIFKFRG